MAYLSILRSTEERCEQCGATEHVLQFVVSQNDADELRLVACLICTVVAMDNAMEWHMSRTFAQALANRDAGEQVKIEAQKARAALNERVHQAEERTRARFSSDAGGRGNTDFLSLRHLESDASKGAAQDDRRSDSRNGDKPKDRKTKG